MEKDTFEKLKIQLYSALETLRSQGQTVTTDLLDRFIENQTLFLTVTPEEKSEIRSYLESHMYVEHDHNGYAIIDDDDENREWYTNSDHANAKHYTKFK